MLKNRFSDEFYNLTKANIGKTLNIVVFDSIYVSEKIVSGIPSGSILVGKWNNKVDAEKMLSKLIE